MSIRPNHTVLAVLLMLSALPFTVSAHGAGAYFETTVNNFIVDIGFSSPAPEVGESVVFDFQIRNVGTTLTSGSDTKFSDVWVRIESEEKTLLATGLYNAEFGGPRLSYVFPKEGTYTIYARYEDGSESLAETSFPMTVVPESGRQGNQEVLFYTLTSIAGVVIGFLLAIIMRKHVRL